MADYIDDALDMEFGDAEIGGFVYPPVKSHKALITEVALKSGKERNKDYDALWVYIAFCDERYPEQFGKKAVIFINMQPEHKKIWTGIITRMFLSAEIMYNKGERPVPSMLKDRQIDVEVRLREYEGEKSNDYRFNVSKEVQALYDKLRKETGGQCK